MRTSEKLAVTGGNIRDGGVSGWRQDDFPYTEACADISQPIATPLGAHIRWGEEPAPLAICTAFIYED